MRNNSRNLLILLLFLCVACSRKATDYTSYLGGKEVIYPGSVNGVNVLPGNQRLELQWHPSPDPSISKYIVYWNNYADSLIVPALSHNPQDTVKCFVNNLQEYNYTFFINSYDSAGNKSITSEVDNAHAYGSIYANSLFNRPPNNDSSFTVTSDQSSVLLRFLTPDTVNINTVVKFTNTAGMAIQQNLSPDSSSILLANYKFGTPVVYQSSYIPKRGAIDTFTTAFVDTFPTIFRLVMCDKSKFNEVHFPYDVGIYESDTYLAKLWDGNATVRAYPDIFHSDDPGGSVGTLPRTLSFDMGAVYNNIGTIEEIGRNCCNNPSDFEIWGIADTTGATPSLMSNDPNWKSMITAKGWTLLTEAVRMDLTGDAPCSVPMKFNFISNPPPVRYIIMRVLKDANGSNAINMSQLTFWYKQ